MWYFVKSEEMKKDIYVGILTCLKLTKSKIPLALPGGGGGYLLGRPVTCVDINGYLYTLVSPLGDKTI